jgi:hypothetical protein
MVSNPKELKVVREPLPINSRLEALRLAVAIGEAGYAEPDEIVASAVQFEAFLSGKPDKAKNARRRRRAA